MDPQNERFWKNSDLVHLIWTQFGMDILIDPRNKPAEEFFIFLKIQDGRQRSNVKKSAKFNPTNHISAP